MILLDQFKIILNKKIGFKFNDIKKFINTIIIKICYRIFIKFFYYYFIN